MNILETFSQSEIEQREKAAHDWGRKDYQTELLNALEEWATKLDYKDIESHIWKIKIEEMIKAVKP